MAMTMFLPVIRSPLAAQTAQLQMAAAAYSQDAFQLTPATSAVTRSIVIDATSSFSVSVLAASRTLTVSLVAPGGTRYSVNDPATNGFENGYFPIDTTNTTPGASYLLSFSNPPAGTWTLEVSEPVALIAPLEVITTTFLNNSTWLVLVGGGDSFPLGTDVRLALVAFSGTNKVSGLSIGARLFRPFDPTFTPVDVTFRDDGAGADELAGDGIYEAFVNPAQTGTYQVQVNASGTTTNGTFSRTAATELRIVPHNAQITGFTDRGVDDNSDGLLERIGITPSANLIEAGTYVISVRLRATNGNEVQRSVTGTFIVGTASAEVTFAAQEIVSDLGVNGPYSVIEVRYFEVVNGDLVPADIRYDLGLTAAYDLNLLQHQSVRLSGTGSATGVDTNGNGLYDVLNINFGVIADVAGSYNYSASLKDRDGRELGFASASVSLQSGTNTLSLTFPGLPIGLGGVDGPYLLANFLLFGAGQSLIATTAFTTPHFLASQFEGFVSTNQPPVILSQVLNTNIDRQTGLFYQQVVITNGGLAAVSGFRLSVTNLPAGARCVSATGTNAGVPFVEFSGSLAPGQTLTFNLAYYSSTRKAPVGAGVSVEAVVVTPPSPSAGQTLAIRRAFLRQDGKFAVEFDTLAGRSYVVEYSSDMNTWKQAQPPVSGNGSRLIWVDSGPPQTESPPASGPRFYRLVLLPQ